MKKTTKIVSILFAALLLIAMFSVTLTVHAADQGLASQYKTNPNGPGIQKTITVDGDIGDWDSSMIIAQGAANDDPRVYRDNSMYEVPIDLYTLYGAYDSQNVYLMWEMTNVQDVVAPNDNYPLTQGILYQTMNVPFFIAFDTGKDDAIGNSGKLTTGGTIWDSGITIENRFNRLIAVSTNGANGPFIYSGNASGLNPKEIYNSKTSGATFKYGLGIKSGSVKGIDGGYGSNNNRKVGDVKNNSAAWVDFNTKGHKSETMDFHYEMAVPLDKLGVTASDVASNGLGVMLISTMGKSGMDCLPYDLSMNDNADKPDTESQEFNSFEKSDADQITADFARIGKGGVAPTPQPTTEPVQPPTDSPVQPTTSDPVSDKTVINAISNIFDSGSVTATGSTVTVTYNLQSAMDLVNGQWNLTYDTSKLRLKSSASKLMPNINGTANIKDNIAYGTFSDINNLFDFKSSKAFVQAEFEVIGTGTANVSLYVGELSVGYKSGGTLVFQNAVQNGQKQNISSIPGFSSSSISGAASVINGTPAEDTKLTVNASSNFFPAASKVVNQTEKQVTVEYLFQSTHDLINSEWTLTYDSSKLRYNSSATGRMMPNAFGAVYSEPEQGRIVGSNSSLDPSDFTTEQPFVRVTFDVLSLGTASVNLNVNILGLINSNVEEGYLVDEGVVKNIKGQSGFSDLSYTTNTRFGNSEPTPALKVKTTSNYFQPTTRSTHDSSTLTTAFKLSSFYDLINAEWELTYDPAKLYFDQANLSKLQPYLDNAVVRETTVGKIKGNFSNINGEDFEMEKDFLTVPFKAIGSGETTVNLKVIFLSVVNEKGQEADLVANGTYSDLSKQSAFAKSSEYGAAMIMPNGKTDRMVGDTNFDGKVDVTDATYVQKYAAEFILFNQDQIAVADVSNDGSVDVADATQIQRIAAR